MTNISRKIWTDLSDAQLLAQCEVDTYRASGPGGQKRNKTSSAVRLRHPPSGLLVIAEESRSQHENKAKALKRLRQAHYLKLRESITVDDALPERPELTQAKNGAGRLDVGRKDVRFWPAAGLVLDVLEAVAGRVSAAAQALGLTTGNVVEFLQTEPKVWEEVQHLRANLGLKPLRMD
ncbi:MAG: peptide chain release factor-like protein [Gemmataceae bacterium]|nr:peptide chain release factor-like protein [Gemmataceae bacterium]MCI0742875.1 peptide chain release factor-like protein [Gemmataceae bacterium]